MQYMTADSEFFLKVKKPGRYLGREWNICCKETEEARIKFALGFPDLYEVGMSNLGLRILYGLLNEVPDVACERFFAPDIDMEQLLLESGRGICSLESARPLKEFDFLGFSLGYELSYTNVLNILRLANIPLRSGERDKRYPLVIAGGPCCVNPEPMHSFFDMFVIGEAEEAILEIIDLYRRIAPLFRKGTLSKEELLIEFSRIEGVYAPVLYEAHYEAGRFKELRPRLRELPLRIKKRFVADLENAYFPVKWLVPYIQIIHDRITLELMRGCPYACRFCQARLQYFPFRRRSPAKALELALAAYKCTGYEELSLAGLSLGDYPGIEELIKKLVDFFQDKAVAVCVPSLRPKGIIGDISSAVAAIKKTGLTLAPEAASEKLRRIINKELNLEELEATLVGAYRLGYRHVKLYFLAGLPGEEGSDLEAIIQFCEQASRLRKRLNLPPAEVHTSVNTLIPKPHTAFQWFAGLGLEAMRHKEHYLKSRLKSRKIKLDFHPPEMSFLEALLSRGDRWCRSKPYIRHKGHHCAHSYTGDNYLQTQEWSK
jgi:radical SAM family uncharacterized protein